MSAMVLERLRLLAACALFVCFGPAPIPALAQASAESVVARTHELPVVLPAEYDGDVRYLEKRSFRVPRYVHMWNEFPEPPRHRAEPPPLTESANAPLATSVAAASMPSASANFAGLGFDESVSGGAAGAGWPPDTNGDVGRSVYVQAVNDAFAIYDKATGTRVAAFTEDQLWSVVSTGTPCNGSNQGDPVVLYDALADHWVLTDFAFDLDASQNPVGPFFECFAVSKSGDPVAGGWWYYPVRIDTGGVPADIIGDYPKFGLWNDGCLYMGANAFDTTSIPPSFVGAIFASFSKANMYAGAALTSSIGFIDNSSDPFAMFPANLLGTSAASMPPSGRPEFFVSESRTAFSFEVRKFTPGFNCGAGGLLSSPTGVNQQTYSVPDGVPQPTPATSSNDLDSLGDRLMQRVNYRKIGSAESIWVVHSTKGPGVNSTVRPQWAQIDVSGGFVATTPVQQQIFVPDTTLYRWMPSLAVDAQGNMAMGYSRANTSSPNFPGIYYAGRLAADAAGTLPQTETVLQVGAGSQLNGPGSLSTTPIPRWGDYSAMSIDPADDCTF